MRGELTNDSTGTGATIERSTASKGGAGRVLVSGASGLVGQALLKRLANGGRPGTKLVRSSASEGEVLWDPASGYIDQASIAADAVVHLAGENIADGRWSQSKMKAIRDSRIRGTRLLAESLARLEKPPEVLISASAIGFYGDRGDEVLTERSPAGSGFLAEVCQEWEASTRAAQDAGIRVVHLRIGVVLARQGGALGKMLLPFKLGLGGRIGNGKQFMSWIALDDLVSAICHAVDDKRLSGPVNASAPFPVTNGDFTRTLGGVLRRPTFAAMPEFAARALIGRMADDLLLASIRVYPQILLYSEFVFGEPRLEGALRATLEKSS
ncbi:MAG: hypothetical protein ACI8QZ_001239 [Chlamydiales bacterium]|jgi:uncharacterized protein (TIGR01777 family)